MQKTTKLISKIIATAILFLALAPQKQQIAQEEPPKLFLLDTKCINTGIGNWDEHTEDVSVGRAVYTSRLYMGSGNSFASMTCKIQPDEQEVNYQTLQLDFGMRDNDRNSPEVEVNVYLDGEKAEAHSRTVSSGIKESVLIPIVNVKNISLETVCTGKSRQYCDRVYFWEASLEIAITTEPSP